MASKMKNDEGQMTKEVRGPKSEGRRKVEIRMLERDSPCPVAEERRHYLRGAENECSFFQIQGFPIAGGQIGEGEVADPDADQAEGGMADGGGHAADLAVFSFGQFESEPACWHRFAVANRGHAGRDFGLRVEHPSVARQGFAA